ncbi:MAG: glycosyltransferase family 4 protein [Clostridiales bacterium]|nr:glycosyltransferase family 4 protein [Clostridiales bacterium]
MEYSTYFLARALNTLPDTFAAVACSDMPDVPSNFPYPYKVYMAKSFSVLTKFLYRRNIERMIKREKINILHGMMFHGGGATAVEIGRKLGIPVITQSHGSDVQEVPEIGYGAPFYPEGLARTKYAIKNSDSVVALSSLIKTRIVELGGAADKIVVIPNGFPEEEISAITKENLRPKYKISDGDFVIVSSGRNRPVKRVDLLFQALSLLKKDRNKIKHVCVGPIENLPEMVRSFDVENMVILTGRIHYKKEKDVRFPPYPELINLYRSANLYVSTSYVEAFNTSELEALACGTPVLVTKNQGIRDVIIEGETGFTLKKDDPETLAETLLELMKMKEELAKRRDYIKNSVSHLNWTDIARRMREVYLSVL